MACLCTLDIYNYTYCIRSNIIGHSDISHDSRDMRIHFPSWREKSSQTKKIKL